MFSRVRHVLVPVESRVREAIRCRHEQVLSSFRIDEFSAHFRDGIVKHSSSVIGSFTYELNLDGGLTDR